MSDSNCLVAVNNWRDCNKMTDQFRKNYSKKSTDQHLSLYIKEIPSKISLKRF